MITAPKRIDFKEPELMHPKAEDGETILDVANRLEHRYNLLAKFVAIRKRDLEAIIADEMAQAIKHDYGNDRMDAAIDGRIKEVWRNFLMNEEHGIRTRAADVNNRQSFIASGAYMGGLTIGVAR